jgi:hypothetical protein
MGPPAAGAIHPPATDPQRHLPATTQRSEGGPRIGRPPSLVITPALTHSRTSLPHALPDCAAIRSDSAGVSTSGSVSRSAPSWGSGISCT